MIRTASTASLLPPQRSVSAIGGVDLEAELAGALGAEVAFGLLVHVERDDLHVRLVPGAAVRIADQEAVAYVLAVRQIAVNGRDDGDALGSGLAR